MNKFKHPGHSKAVVALWVAALVLGGVHAFVSRYSMNADGVSYVDIGVAYFRLPAHQAVSGYFSPLYSWLLGSFLLAFQPNAHWENPVIHLVNYLLFLFAFWSFQRFVNDVLRLKRTQAGLATDYRQPTDNEWPWVIFFYVLFVWAALRMITLAMVAPDMLYTAILFLLFSQLLRIRLEQSGWLSAAGLGLILGAAYLTRAAVMPVLFVVLISFPFLCERRRFLPRLLVVIVIFLLVAGPYATLLSSARKRLTFGDAGTMNYAWLINEKPFQNWQGPGALHPTRLIYQQPAVYEFATPIPGTYPPWYDPSYWGAGMVPEYHLIPLIGQVIRNSKHLFDYFLDLGGVLVGLIGLHLAARTRLPSLVKGLWPVWFLILPSVAALGMYAALHVEPRYIVPFWLTLWIAMFLALPYSFHNTAPPFSHAILAAMVAFLAAGILQSTFVLMHESNARNNLIAAGLEELPVHPGEEVATIGVSNDVYWARLARVRIVAEIPLEGAADFWAAPPVVKSEIYDRLAEKGVGAIVANGVPGQAASNPWHPAGNGFYACRLSELRKGR